MRNPAHDGKVLSDISADVRSSDGNEGSAASNLARLAQQEPSLALSKGGCMTGHARGTFEIQFVNGPEEKIEGVSLGKRSADKQYSGDIEGSAKGEMLAALTNIKTSAGYVAIERVVGTLHGRKGTFLLQHAATMSGTMRDLSVTVVPDSGTGELVGISGKMMIHIIDGKHSYEFDYAFPDSL
jgi:uncharacterized protein DUF3224